MGNTGKILRFGNFLLFKNKTDSGIPDVFRELEATIHQLNNKAHMHDQLVIKPEETK